MNTKTSTTVVSHNVDVSTTRSSSSVSTVNTTYTNNVSKSTKSSASGTINLSDLTTPTKNLTGTYNTCRAHTFIFINR